MNRRLVQVADLARMKFVGEARLSPDGRRIAYTLTRVEAERNAYSSQIHWLDVDQPATQEDGDAVGRALTRGHRIVRSAQPDGDPARQPLPSRDWHPRWSPDGRWLAFLSNRAGKDQVWLIPTDGGEARQLTQHGDAVQAFEWSPDGQRMVFVAKPPAETKTAEGPPDRPDWARQPDVTVVTRLRYKMNGAGIFDGRRKHLWLLDVASGRARQITDGDWDDASPAWTPDGGAIVFSSARREDRDLTGFTDLYEVPVEGGEPRRLTFIDGLASSPAVSPDGAHVAFVGHDKGQASGVSTHVWVVGRESGETRCLMAEFDRGVGNHIATDSAFDRDPGGLVWADDGFIYFITTDRGRSHLARVASSGAASVEMVTEGVGRVSSFDVQAGRLALVGGDALRPGDVYGASIATSSGDGQAADQPRTGSMPVQVTRLTDVNRALLAEWRLSEPEDFSFEGADGWPIQGWLLKPPGFDPSSRYPIVLEIHGGPYAAYGDAFMFEFQLLAAAGMVVLYCNPRGSAGYGEAFSRGVIGDWGGKDYLDLMAATTAAAMQPWADASRLGVTGGSYGGYMTNWIVTQTTRFRAAVTQRSISNLYTKYGTSDIGFYANRAGMAGHDLWDSEEFIMSRSPIRHAPRVKTPILIIHSEDDLRCPIEQAEQWFIALKRLGVRTEFVRFKGENHELSRSGRPWNRAERLARILHWFKRALRPVPPTP